MRIVFMGTPDFAVGPLEALLGAGQSGDGRNYPAGQAEGPGENPFI